MTASPAALAGLKLAMWFQMPDPAASKSHMLELERCTHHSHQEVLRINPRTLGAFTKHTSHLSHIPSPGCVVLTFCWDVFLPVASLPPGSEDMYCRYVSLVKLHAACYRWKSLYLTVTPDGNRQQDSFPWCVKQLCLPKDVKELVTAALMDSDQAQGSWGACVEHC